MNTTISRSQLLDMIQTMVIQSQLLPDTITDQASDLNTEDLEKLTITLHTALQTEQRLSKAEHEQLNEQVARYFEGKSRIYAQAQQAWIAQQEAKHEHQESLFEEALLQQL